jgi:hypothetical protein
MSTEVGDAFVDEGLDGFGVWINCSIGGAKQSWREAKNCEQ